MKNSVFQIYFLPILLLTGILMNSCDNQSSKVKSLKEENRQLKRERAQTEENLYELSKTINFIQSNLDTIKQQEQIISTIANSDIENQPSAKEQISNDITSIYNKLIANRRQLSKLQQSLNKDASQNKDLKAIIDRLNEQMDEKIIQIENLRGQLEQMQGK